MEFINGFEMMLDSAVRDPTDILRCFAHIHSKLRNYLATQLTTSLHIY